MFAVTVHLEVVPGAEEPFLALALTNAANSFRQEEGCRQFDVCLNEEEPGTVFFYEIYENRAAFGLHLSSKHFKAFDAAVKDMVVSKTVTTFGEVWQ